MEDAGSAADPRQHVSRETGAALQRFVDLLEEWSRAKNLVARSTLDEVWTRHIADSAQLAALQPQAVRWLDLGSGAGFPGLVLAILLREADGAHVDLVEANGRKAAFLRTVVHELHLPARVHAGRVEALLPDWNAPVDVVTARAFAPLPRLLCHCGHLLAGPSVGLFPKGADYLAEIAAAERDWSFRCRLHPSRTHHDARILELTHVAPLPAAAGKTAQ